MPIPEFRLRRIYPRPAPGEQAPRPSGGVCGPDSATPSACGARSASCVARPKRAGTLLRACPRNFACGEYSHALRLTSELVDLRAANANRILPPSRQSRVRWRVSESKTKSTAIAVLFVLEAPPGIGPGMKVLQTSALPLGYGAIFFFEKMAGTKT